MYEPANKFSKLTRKDYLKLLNTKKKTTKKRKKKFVLSRSQFVKYLPLIQLISSKIINKKQKQLLVDSMTKEQMGGINELIENFLNKNIQLSPINLRQLMRYKNIIRLFSANKKNFNAQKIIGQKGGFLGALTKLIPFAVKAIGPAISSIADAIS